MEEEAQTGTGVEAGVQLPSLVFLGTPDFALPSLQKLATAGAHLPLVVTQPDRAQGRGRKLAPPPIKVLAEKLGLPVIQPERIRAQETVELICSQGAECLVVVAYGQLLPQVLLERHPLGAINVHASLLPAYRGAAPIHRALLAGEAATGITMMLLDAGMDTGPILRQRKIAIDEQDICGSLHDRLAHLGADLLPETLGGWKTGKLVPAPQNSAQASYAPPLHKEEMRLNWRQDARQIVNQIRAFDPAPGARCQYQGKRLKCFAACLLAWKGPGRAGEIVGASSDGLVVLGGDGQALGIGSLQLDGHRRLAAHEFILGHQMPRGTCLE
jgi:methionyl-tRNA formyltransferase